MQSFSSTKKDTEDYVQFTPGESTGAGCRSLTSSEARTNMGWGHQTQQIAGKRMRHSSANRETSDNMEQESEDPAIQFISKRSRDDNHGGTLCSVQGIMNTLYCDNESTLNGTMYSNPPEGKLMETTAGVLLPSTYLSSMAEINGELSCHAHQCSGDDSPFKTETKDLHHCDGIDRILETESLGKDTDDDYATFLGIKIKTSSIRNFNFRSLQIKGYNTVVKESPPAPANTSIPHSNSTISMSKRGPRLVLSMKRGTGRGHKRVIARSRSSYKVSSEEKVVSDEEAYESDSDGEQNSEEVASDVTSLNATDDLAEESQVSASSSVDIVPSTESIPNTLPPIRPSCFPNVPPYLNFCAHNEQVEALPPLVRKHLKWRWSSITPVVVRKTVENSGFRLLRKTVEWGGQWGKHMKAAVFKNSLKEYQKLNHIPGTFQIGRKDRLWKNVYRYMTKFGKDEFGFMPRSYVLPQDTKNLKKAWDLPENRGQPWIVKPPAAARGSGIYLINKWNQIPKKKSVVVQSYISKPYLINDRKFDIRLYVLVTSFHPLKIYMFNDGLVRFAPVKYSREAKRIGDRFMHLTNYSVNRNCELYTQNEDADACQGHKWTLKTLWRYLQEKQVNTDELWEKMEEIIIKTCISAEDLITSAAQNLPNRYNGYELFGFDIIFDDQLKPWLLEVNISPSLHSSSPLDLAVKGPLIKEVFNIVGFHISPKIPVSMKNYIKNNLDIPVKLETAVFDKRLYTGCLSRFEKYKHQRFRLRMNEREEYLDKIIEDLTPDDLRQLITAQDELSQCDNFIRIFPTESSYTFFPYFESHRYYNMLLDAWECKYSEKRNEGIQRLKNLCSEKVHLQVPSVCRRTICTSQVPTTTRPDDKTTTKTEDHSRATQQMEKNEVATVQSNANNNNGQPEDILSAGDTELKVATDNSTTCFENESLTVGGTLQSSSQVLDNITNTNNSPRNLSVSLGATNSNSSNNCHDEISNEKPPIKSKVGDLINGMCY